MPNFNFFALRIISIAAFAIVLPSCAIEKTPSAGLLSLDSTPLGGTIPPATIGTGSTIPPATLGPKLSIVKESMSETQSLTCNQSGASGGASSLHNITAEVDILKHAAGSSTRIITESIDLQRSAMTSGNCTIETFPVVQLMVMQGPLDGATYSARIRFISYGDFLFSRTTEIQLADNGSTLKSGVEAVVRPGHTDQSVVFKRSSTMWRQLVQYADSPVYISDASRRAILKNSAFSVYVDYQARKEVN